MADRSQHPLHLVLAAFVEDQLDPAGADPAGTGGSGASVLEVDAVAQPLQVLLVRIPLDVCDVRLLDAVARVGEPMREAPVVREQERSRRVGVEPPDRDDAWPGADELDHGSPPVRVAGGRDDAPGLVQEDVREPLPRHRPPVDLDAVAGTDDGIELPGLAVDGDAAGLDQLIGTPARSDSRSREEGVESHSAEGSSAKPCRMSGRVER